MDTKQIEKKAQELKELKARGAVPEMCCKPKERGKPIW